MKIDVVVLTKNSEFVLDRCLRSVYANVPVNKLIVVDGHSEDGTLGILERYNRRFGNVRVVFEGGSRGRARERGIREVGTEWFLFVDSDVVLCEGWFRKVRGYMKGGVGAIWGVDVPEGVTGGLMTRFFKWVETRVFDIRGGCHDMLVRSEAVRGVRIPGGLHTLEDTFIKGWILSRGYEVLVSHSSYCVHCKPVNVLLSKVNVVSTLFELRSFGSVRERWVYVPVFMLVWYIAQIKNRGQPI